VRLASTTVLLDGAPRSIFDVLEDPELANVFTYEGTIRDAARIMGYESGQQPRTIGARATPYFARRSPPTSNPAVK
jgi:hypothetical protein